LLEGGFCDGFWEMGPVGEVNYLRVVERYKKDKKEEKDSSRLIGGGSCFGKYRIREQRS